MDLNKVTLIGNLVGDPKRVGKVVSFSVATNYQWERLGEKRQSVDFHDIASFGKLGDIIEQYLRKGAKVYVEGRLRKRSYVAADGSKHPVAEVLADNLIMLGHRTSTAQAPSSSSRTLIKDDVDVDEVAEETMQ